MKSIIEQKVNNRECSKKSYALKYPVYFEKGEGLYLYDSENKRYIDCLNGFGVNILGHNHPIITEGGINFFTKKIPFQIIDLMSSVRDKFIDTLFSLFPENMKNNIRIQFAGGSGSDAVESALELARKYTNRDGIMAFSGCYHGLTQGSMALTGNACDKVGGISNVIHLPYPHSYRCPLGIGGKDAVTAIVNYIENLLDDPKRGFITPAAMIIETVQSDGGIIVAPIRFIQEIRRITKERGMLLIIDEIQTGFGKTGKMFGFEHAGITPDIVVLSKAFGCGMPLSAIVFDDKIDIPCTHGTFRGNQIGLYLGDISMKYIVNNNILDNIINIEMYIKTRLDTLKRKYSCIGDIRVKGILFAIEFCIPGTNTYNSDKTLDVFNKCFDNNLLCKLGGRNYSSLIFWTNLIIQEGQIDDIFEILDISIC
jgi:diaminobutyrate-2-oxoglutarate transaminase